MLPTTIAYFGLMWALLEFTGFIVERYALRDAWIDVAFLAIFAYLPLALLLGWKIGAPGRVRWSARSLTAVAGLAFAGSAVLALPLWRAADAPTPAPPEAAARGVVDVDERISSVLLYPFALEGDAGEFAWFGEAIPELVDFDLSYDPRFAARSAQGSTADLLAMARRLGASSIAAAPLSIRRQLARAHNYRAFVSGQLRVHEAGLQLRFELHRLQPEGVLGPFEVEVADLWQAADAIAAEVRRSLAPPRANAAGNDPAVRAVSSESLPAIRAYVDGSIALNRDRNLVLAEQKLLEAEALDPGFVLASFRRVLAQWMQLKLVESQQGLAALEPRLDALPERMRYGIQVLIRNTRSDPVGERQVYELWTRALPWDRTPQRRLLELDLAADPEDARAWAALTELTLASGSATELIATANRQYLRDAFAQARELAEMARDRDPSDTLALYLLADIAAAQGELAAARAHLDSAALLRPDLVTPLIRKSQLEKTHGDPLAALEQLRALRAQRQLDPGQQETVLAAEFTQLSELGRLREARRVLDERLAIARQRRSPAEVQSVYFAGVPVHALLHGADAARAWATADGALPDARMQAWRLASIDLAIAYALEDGPLVADATARYAQAITDMGQGNAVEQLKLYALFASAWPGPMPATDLGALEALLGAELRRVIGQGAIEGLERHHGMLVLAAHVALDAGALAAAQGWIEAYRLRAPRSPTSLWLQVRLAHAQGEGARTRELLQSLEALWRAADPEHREAAAMRQLWQELGMPPTAEPAAPASAATAR